MAAPTAPLASLEGLTPLPIITKVPVTLGGTIHLDPCSNGQDEHQPACCQ